MNSVFEIDLAQSAGKIRKLHGGNLGPTLARGKGTLITAPMRELEIPLTRLHDAPWENNGMKLVDIPMIFPLFHLDHQDPRNYYFEQTDDYLAGCFDIGTKIMYRLGVTIEHTARNYFTQPPTDIDKWTEICINIIRHYNEGWADGFTHNIEYWELWGEPNLVPALWAGTWEEYLHLYVTASRRIKQRFPHLKIGGPSFAEIGEVIDMEMIDSFLTTCRKEGAPLDFFSWHNYTTKPDLIISDPHIMRETLDRHGYTDSELHLNEWHYRWGTDDEWNGPVCAAYIGTVLIGLQDTPVDMANYYTATTTSFGLFSETGIPNKCYHAMKAFALLTHFADRVAVRRSEGTDDVRVLVGTCEGRYAALVSCFKHTGGTIDLRFEHLPAAATRCTVRLLDVNHNLDEVGGHAIVDGTLSLRRPGGSAMYYIEFGPDA